MIADNTRSCPSIADSSFCRSNKRMTVSIGKQYHIFEKNRFNLSTKAHLCAIISVRLQRRRLFQWRISRKRPHVVRLYWPMCEPRDENHAECAYNSSSPTFSGRGCLRFTAYSMNLPLIIHSHIPKLCGTSYRQPWVRHRQFPSKASSAGCRDPAA